jgi:hypothetical protein
MITRRFTSEELYQLRNSLPINSVLQRLEIPYHYQGATCRFRCPNCRGHHTATHSGTNLARCFDCQRNYNTIDLVMLTQKATFVSSVKFLKELLRRQEHGEDA